MILNTSTAIYVSELYHVMARGNARQKIVRDDTDRGRLLEGLEHAVIRYGWELPTYVFMGNHLHLLVKTSRPNFGAGMQTFLSGYAIWSGRRWRRTGHLFQGRYRTEMIRPETTGHHRGGRSSQDNARNSKSQSPAGAVENKSRVEVWRGGLGLAYQLPALSSAGASLA